LLSLLIKALNIKQACLLFPEPGSGDYKTQFFLCQYGTLQIIKLQAEGE